MRYAYVTFLIKNDGYLPGALTLAYSIKRFDDAETICLVSEEISENAKYALRLVYDNVAEIKSIRLKHCIKTGRQDRNELLTRFAPLLLDYDEIILLDADVLVLSDIRELFDVPAPAGIINERKENFISDRNLINGGKWHWHEEYDGICPHGEKIPSYITDRPGKDAGNLGVNSALWRLTPSKEAFNEILDALKTPEVLQLYHGFAWAEMQLATILWSGRWTSIDVKYCSIGGYPSLELLKSTHFAGLKPWSINNKSIKRYSRYPDFKEWYSVFLQLFYSYPPLRGYKNLKRLEEFILYNKIL